LRVNQWTKDATDQEWWWTRNLHMIPRHSLATHKFLNGLSGAWSVVSKRLHTALKEQEVSLYQLDDEVPPFFLPLQVFVRERREKVTVVGHYY
jgi:hypothetical protein